MFLNQIQQHVVVRAAMRPFNSMVKYDQLKDNRFSPALYLASHSIHQKYCAQANITEITDKKLLYPLVRYHLRMATRATPFGLFSGCGVSFSSPCQNIRIDTQQAQLYARLDNLVLHSLTQRISCIPAIQRELRYFPNSSLYLVHGELQYIEYTLTNNNRSYKISAVANSNVLNDIINFCQSGAHWVEIAQFLEREHSATQQQAEDYLQALFTSQLLVSELEPTITGEEYLSQAICLLQNFTKRSDGTPKSSQGNAVVVNEAKEVKQVLVLLEDLADRLCQIRQGTTSLTEQGPYITEKLRFWLPDLIENKLFQVDTIFSDIRPASLVNSQNEILSKTVSILNKLASSFTHPSLSTFTTRFYQRFEDQEIPLAQALDSDIGADYLKQSEQMLSPLLRELVLPLPSGEDTLVWDKHQTWKWNLLQENLRRQQYTVELTDEMLRDFTTSEHDLPPSMSITFRKVEKDRFYIDSVGGVSATNPLNRFAYADPVICKVVQQICDQEQQDNPEIVFAEIVHLPESRVGNVIFHPTSRAYEIPYLAASAVDTDYQLPLSDLYISVKNGEIILRSQKLNMRIIPRLSTAHNHRLSELPVYRFLCDLQSQGLRTDLSFHWGRLANRFKFLPRVVYQNVILHPATWQLEEADLTMLKAAKSQDDFQAAFQSFCEQYRLPRRWVLADVDNELFVDTKQSLIVEAWWDLAKKRKQLTIKEFFAPAEGAVVNERGKAHAHQLVASWIKQQPTYAGLSKKQPASNEDIMRSFSPGSEWLYYKLYGGLSTADRILEEIVHPLVQQLQQEQKIAQWFFIRYADPDAHLRLRFRLSDIVHLAEVMQQMRAALLPFEQAAIFSKTQLDTYHRELERYGGKAIVQAEQLFHYDSEAVLQFLSLTEGDEREDLRWLWSLRSIDALLDDFQVALPEKLSLLQSMRDSFAQKFKMDKPLKLQLDKKYREYRSAINDMLALQDPADMFFPLVEILQQRSARNASVVSALREAQEQNSLPLSLTNLLRSCIHMLINRLIPSQAPFHELVLYDFLYREYRSEVARHQKQYAVNKS